MCLKRAGLWLGVSKQEIMYTLFGERLGKNFKKERDNESSPLLGV